MTYVQQSKKPHSAVLAARAFLDYKPVQSTTIPMLMKAPSAIDHHRTFQYQDTISFGQLMPMALPKNVTLVVSRELLKKFIFLFDFTKKKIRTGDVA